MAHPQRGAACGRPWRSAECATGRRALQDRCGRCGGGRASRFASRRKPPSPASPCASRSCCGRARRCPESGASAARAGRPQSAWRPARRPRRVPVGERASGESEPDGQTPARAETRLVLPPIPDTGGRLDVLPLGARDTRHAGPRISGWRAMIDRDRELCTKAPWPSHPRPRSRGPCCRQ